MNSQQRRKDRRRWRYSVITDNRRHEQYLERWEWLAENYGRHNDAPWRERNNWRDIRWEFVDEKIAVAFALRWV